MQSVSRFRLRDAVLGVLATVLIAIAAPAAADPILVTDGVVTVDSTDPSYFRFTTDGFSIIAAATFPMMELGPHRDCLVTPCTTGISFDTSAQITHNPLNSTTDFPGVHLDGVAYPSAVVDGYILINGPRGIVPALENGAPTGVIIQGMLLDALLTVYADASRSGTPLLTTQLSGRGSLGVRFVPGVAVGTVEAWDLSYRFGGDAAPVPEPGTLFLVAAGATCLLKRRAALPVHGTSSGD